MNVLLIDPGLLNMQGHHYHTDLALFQALSDQHCRTTILGNRDVEQDIRSALPVRPVFRATAYPDRDGKDSDSLWADFHLFNKWVEEDLKAASLEWLTEEDLIVVPTVRDIHVTGIFAWYTSLPEPRPKICLRLMFLPHFRTAQEDLQTALELSAEQMRLWRSVPEDRLILVAETQELADYYEQLCGLRASVFPLIVRYTGENTTEPPTTVAPFPRDFAFLGEARKEKGAHLIPDAFSGLYQKYPDTRLTVQTSCLMDAGPDYRDKLRRLSPRVDLLDAALTADAYNTAIASADVLLLPYDPKKYMLRTSLIFLEAVGAGKPVLVTSNTWMHRVMLDLGLPDISMSEYSSDGLLQAIHRMIERWPDITAKTAYAAKQLRDSHNPTKFVDALLDAASPAPFDSKPIIRNAQQSGGTDERPSVS